MSVARGGPQPSWGGVRRGGIQKARPRATAEDTATFKLCTFCWAKVQAMLNEAEIKGQKNHANQQEEFSKYTCRPQRKENKKCISSAKVLL